MNSLLDLLVILGLALGVSACSKEEKDQPPPAPDLSTSQPSDFGNPSDDSNDPKVNPISPVATSPNNPRQSTPGSGTPGSSVPGASGSPSQSGSSQSAPKPNEMGYQCQERDDYLKQALSEDLGIMDAIDQVSNQNTQLFMLGENHLHYGSFEFYPKFIMDLKQRYAHLNCLFLELPSDYQDAIDDFKKGEDFDATIGPLLKEDLITFGRLHELRREVFETARDQGLQIFAVDLDRKSREGITPNLKDPRYLELVKQRDQEMAERINKSFKRRIRFRGRKCEMAIFPVGTRHLSAWQLSAGQTAEAPQWEQTFGKRLPQLLASLQKVKIYLTGTPQSGADTWNWPGCPAVDLGDREAGFRLRWSRQRVATDLSRVTSHWNDFDVLAVVPGDYFSFSDF